MKAKDKAEELIEKFGIEKALICVDEIIIAVSMCYSDETVINYWKQVKQEILNRQ